MCLLHATCLANRCNFSHMCTIDIEKKYNIYQIGTILMLSFITRNFYCNWVFRERSVFLYSYINILINISSTKIVSISAVNLSHDIVPELPLPNFLRRFGCRRSNRISRCNPSQNWPSMWHNSKSKLSTIITNLIKCLVLVSGTIPY